MDPNATLKDLRDMIDDGPSDGDDSYTDRLCELFDALDDWMTAGGFAPNSWRDLETSDDGITMIREIHVEYRHPAEYDRPITKPAFLAQAFRTAVGRPVEEHVWMVGVDARYRPVAHRVVSIGTERQSVLHPGVIFSYALQMRAVAVFIAHNHPSGDPTPSVDDRLVFDRLKEGGGLLGVDLLDSIIVGEGAGFSLAADEEFDFREPLGAARRQER